MNKEIHKLAWEFLLLLNIGIGQEQISTFLTYTVFLAPPCMSFVGFLTI